MGMEKDLSCVAHDMRMPIYTKFGDQGKTALLGGEVVPKSDLRVEAYGSVDELNAALGLVISFSASQSLKSSLSKIQKDLFTIGASLASQGKSPHRMAPARISELESEIDAIEKELPPLRNFILPGGSKTSSMLHLARTVCRRAERAMVALSEKAKPPAENLIYMNRVGDLLFVMARAENYRKRVPEALWKAHPTLKR